MKNLEKNKKEFLYTNYYPVFFIKLKKNSAFFKKFKANFDVDFINYIQFSSINHLEFFLQKKIFLKISNNLKLLNFHCTSAI